MWGKDNEEMRTVHIEDATYELKDVAKPRLHFVGRRTFTSVASKMRQDADEQPDASEAPTMVASGPSRRRSTRSSHKPQPQQKEAIRDDGEYYFKAAWAECSRTKEPDIVSAARTRAEEHLGDYRSYVLDHIPQIDNWEERTQTSTGIIRELLNESSARSRVQIIIVARRFCKLVEVEDSRSFLSAFWDAVRCT